MTVTGPDFIALQVSDLERSAEFYENALGLRRGSGAARLARGLRNSNPGRSCSQPLRPDVHLRRSGWLCRHRSREGVVT